MARKKKESDEEFFKRLIDKQFEIAGHNTDISYDVLVANKEEEDNRPFGEAWYQRYTWNKEQEEEFREWLEVEMKKRFKYLRGKALQTQIGMFLLMWGLKCEDCIEDLKY